MTLNFEPMVGTKVMNQYVSDKAAVYQADAVEMLKGLPSDSIDFGVWSPPFSNAYCYSASERDFGNCKGDEEFFAHHAFLVDQMARVIKPGRLVAMHCWLAPSTKERDGYIGFRDFRGDLIRAFQKGGFIFHSEVTIYKSPVIQMVRTKALGLLYKQLRKDSAMSRQGIADYIVVMRRPGINPEPITHTHETFPLERWQRYADPVWFDIKEGDTLQKESAREEKDEKHLVPLQKEVIRRAIELWSNPGDVVIDPFTGIGSTGYVAIQEGRRFLGSELKKSYWDQAVANIARAEKGDRQAALDFGT